MIKLPKRLILALSYLSLLLAALYLLFIYRDYDKLEFFNRLNGYFSSVLILGIFIAIYRRDYKYIDDDNSDFFCSPWLTMLLQVVHALIIAIFIKKMLVLGFLSDIILYWQISSIVLAIVSVSILLKMHVELLKNRHKNKNK